MKKGIVLLSGGVDSCVILAMLRQKWSGVDCLGLSFDYGQKHVVELKSAKKIAEYYRIEHRIIRLDSACFAGSSLTGNGEIPKKRTREGIALEGIPSTYVPARNTLFLAYAMSHAESYSAEEIHFGPNALDQVPYPDCRPSYIEAFQLMMNCATKQAVEGKPLKLVTPLLKMNKVEIVEAGLALRAPLHFTFSCYDPSSEGVACESCDACLLRNEAFNAAHSRF